jgi:putative transposase
VAAPLVGLVLDQFLRAAQDEKFVIIAYCFMPDHVHLLVEGNSPDARLPKFVKRAKQLSGFAARQVIEGKLWQTGYFEHVLRAHEDTRRVVAYILGNPVRAGLVEDPRAYPFSGSGQYQMDMLVDHLQNVRAEGSR